MEIKLKYGCIQPSIYVGSYPASFEDVEFLKIECKVSAILNLQTDTELLWYKMQNIDWLTMERYYQACQIEVVRMPILDLNLIDMKNKLKPCAKVLEKLLCSSKKVYVHCTAGINRSPTVVMAYLHWYGGYELESAIKLVQACHNCEPDLNVLYSF